tara:strand:+ start:527 stop:649 length:123 start_codon:yes stop_codon:yes gene_type:complete
VVVVLEGLVKQVLEQVLQVHVVLVPLEEIKVKQVMLELPI